MKWVLHSFEPRDSNLQCLFKHCLKRYNPHKHYKWPPNLAWCLQRITRNPLTPYLELGRESLGQDGERSPSASSKNPEGNTGIKLIVEHFGPSL
jgi:hypothetical protein